MIAWLVLLWGMGFGCAGGARHPSQIDDLQVVAMVASFPSITAGSSVDLTLHVASPRANVPIEAMIWSCTPNALLSGDDSTLLSECVEEELVRSGTLDEDDLIPVIRTGEFAPGQIQLSTRIPDGISSVLRDLDGETVSVFIYALVCEQGQCPLIQQVSQEITENNGLSNETRKQLSDPGGLLVGLPSEGVTLTQRALRILNANQPINTNPDFEPRFLDANEQVVTSLEVTEVLELELDDDGTVGLNFLVTDAEGDRPYAYAYTTAGQFIERRVRADIKSGQPNNYDVRHFLVPPAGEGSGQVYVVFDDREGGAAVWWRNFTIVE
ncbi:MAG: hypothetical protein AAFV53_42290 [Myxococcota bacterium]